MKDIKLCLPFSVFLLQCLRLKRNFHFKNAYNFLFFHASLFHLQIFIIVLNYTTNVVSNAIYPYILQKQDFVFIKLISFLRWAVSKSFLVYFILLFVCFFKKLKITKNTYTFNFCEARMCLTNCGNFEIIISYYSLQIIFGATSPC